MAQRLSRRKIAAYYAEQLLAGNKNIAGELAAYLVDSRRIRELELIVRDVEAALMTRGVLLADITSSRTLTADAAKEIKSYLKTETKADTIHLRETVDADLLGGVRIAVPGSELDATLRHRLTQLKASKI
jgi:F0F1-type ATP synthase delta subunit